MKKQPKCIIFDCDGVLVDSENITCQIIATMAQEIGIDVDFHFIEKHFVGNSWGNNKATLERAGNKKLPETFYDEYRRRAFQAFKEELQPIKGIPKLVNSLTVPYAVASSGPPEKIRLNLDIIGLLEKFEPHVYSCWDIGKWKPDPAIYLHTAAALNFHPSECVVVEDSVLGARAGIAGGFRTIGYASEHTASALRTTGAEVIFDMEELYEIVPTISFTSNS